MSDVIGPTTLSYQLRASTLNEFDSTWNFWLGVIASIFLIMLAASVLIGLTCFRNYLRRRNRTLSDDTGIFAPRRGSKAGLDMIDHDVKVILTQHRILSSEEEPLQDSASKTTSLRASSAM